MEQMDTLYSQQAWLIPLFPLISFILLTTFGNKWHIVARVISLTASILALIWSLLVFVEQSGDEIRDYFWSGLEWLQFGSYSISLGYEVTHLNALFLLMISALIFLVQLDAVRSIRQKSRIVPFYGYTSLLGFSLLSLLLSENMLQFYLFWELMSVASFLLLGFVQNQSAQWKNVLPSFIVTRIGDLCLLTGILLLFWSVPSGDIRFTAIHNAFYANQAKIPETVTFWIAGLLLLGAVGKSFQYALYSWLKQSETAIAPTMALLQAVTLLPAGGILIAKTFSIFLAAPAILDVMAYGGGWIAMVWAWAATMQRSIRRMLTYSTISQMGWLLLSFGLGSSLSYTAAVFSLLLHAFIKAFLVLISEGLEGSNGCEKSETDGLFLPSKELQVAFAIGALALSGLFPFAGYWSSSAILSEAWDHHMFLFCISAVSVLLTSYSMCHLFFEVRARVSGSKVDRNRGSGMKLAWVVMMTIITVSAGWVLSGDRWFENWLTDGEPIHVVSLTAMITANVAALLGLVGSLFIRVEGSRDARIWQRISLEHNVKSWVVFPLHKIGQLLAWFDRKMMDGAEQGVFLWMERMIRLAVRRRKIDSQSNRFPLIVIIFILMIVAFGRRFIHFG